MAKGFTNAIHYKTAKVTVFCFALLGMFSNFLELHFSLAIARDHIGNSL